MRNHHLATSNPSACQPIDWPSGKIIKIFMSFLRMESFMLRIVLNFIITLIIIRNETMLLALIQ